MERGLKAVKGRSWETLVYSHALEISVHIVTTIMTRFYQEDDPEAFELANLGAGSKPLPECLVQLFGLLEATQQTDFISKAVAASGLVNKTKTRALTEANTDILRMISLTLALGQCSGKAICSKEDVPLPAEGIVGLLPTFVTPAQIVQFSNDNGKLQDVLISILGESWNTFKKKAKVCDKRGSQSTVYAAINKQGLAVAFGNKNKSNVSPGLGRMPILSTCCLRLAFDHKVMGQFLLHSADKEEVKDARYLAVEFSMLCVDHVAPGPISSFERLWEELDPNGFLKKNIIAQPTILDMKGKPFFDKERAAIIAAAGNGASPGTEGSKQEDHLDKNGEDNTVSNTD
ncbi:unnamed protein product [Pylaiella littoralis]